MKGKLLLMSALVMASSGFAAQPRHVRVDEESVTSIYTQLGRSTLLELPKDEEIRQGGTGDLDGWRIECGESGKAGAKNVCHAHPTRRGAETNLNLVTAAGNTYSFELLPADKSHRVDLKVFVERDPPRKLRASIVPDPGVDSSRAELTAALSREVDLKERLDAANRLASERVDPRQVKFDYEFSKRWFFFRSTPKALIFHDDKSTLVQGPNVDLLESLADKPSVQVGVCQQGLCVLPRILDQGFIRVGKKTFKFERRKAKKS